MHHQSQELFLAKVKAIVKGPHASMLNELIFILGNPLNNCRNGPDDGPMGALRQIIHYIYQNFTDDYGARLGDVRMPTPVLRRRNMAVPSMVRGWPRCCNSDPGSVDRVTDGGKLLGGRPKRPAP